MIKAIDPSFGSHRNTDAITEMQRIIAPLQTELETIAMGDARRLVILQRITRAYLQSSHYYQTIAVGTQFEIELTATTNPDVSAVVNCMLSLATAFREKQQFQKAEEYYLKAAEFL